MTHRYQWFGGETFAQHGDDLIILNIFSRLAIERPSYLDIGAYHPFDLSNTALLYRRGSRGVNVDADPELIAAFKKQRPGDVNLAVGVADKVGERTFYRARERGRSSFVQDYARPHDVRDSIVVPVTTANKLMESHGCPDLLSIDAEGLEADIIASIDYRRFAPALICVEAPSFIGGSDKTITATLTGVDYAPCFRAGSNLFFVRNKFGIA